MESSSYRLWLAYHGGGFSGFQSQKNALTVQDSVQEALEKILGHGVVLTAAGRTDAGVHAQALAASFDLATKLTLRNLTLALATKLTKKVAVFRIDKFPLGFNARFHSIGKRYVYRIYQGLVPDPFLYETTLHVKKELCVKSMQEAANYLIGEHDFNSFRSQYCKAMHAIRYIWFLNISKQNNVIEIDIRGNAFCLNMNRIIVGTLIEAGLKKIKPIDVYDILMKKDRKYAKFTAKPHGLFLNQVYYPDNIQGAGISNNAVFPRYPITKDTWPFLQKDILYGPQI